MIDEWQLLCNVVPKCKKVLYTTGLQPFRVWLAATNKID